MPRDALRIGFVPREPIGRGQHRQVMVPQDFPDVFNGPDLLDLADVDVEGVALLRRAATRAQVQEPVRSVGHIFARPLENRPASGQQLIGSAEERASGLG